MQKGVLKFLVISIMVFSGIREGSAQTSSYRLLTADSLFRSRQYTQSMTHYEAVLGNHEYTPAMLLKMAYIQEGLNQTGRALYYLTLYHQVTGDVSALRKMEELATKNNLQGYQTSDVDRLLTWYREWHFYISLSIASVCVMLVAIAFYRKFRLHTRPIVTAVFLGLTAVLLFAHLRYGESISVGIIADSNTYIMNGPSPGADLVERVQAGHRIEVIGKTDVWLKVRWNGQVAYVKEKSVLTVIL